MHKKVLPELFFLFFYPIEIAMSEMQVADSILCSWFSVLSGLEIFFHRITGHLIALHLILCNPLNPAFNP